MLKPKLFSEIIFLKKICVRDGKKEVKISVKQWYDIVI